MPSSLLAEKPVFMIHLFSFATHNCAIFLLRGVKKSCCRHLCRQVAPVSMQRIPRNTHAPIMTTLALIAASLEKFATEIRGLQRTEIHELEEPFGHGQTGSSSMPHKRNPELAERICGLARLIRGNSLTAMENVALWGERDISHSSAERIILPDSALAARPRRR